MSRKNTIIKVLIILLVIGILATLGFLSWQVAKEKQRAKETQIPKEEKQISEKDETKEEKDIPKIPEFIPKQETFKITEIEEIPIEPFDASTWNVYRNEEFGFEIRYPEEGKISIKRVTHSEFKHEIRGWLDPEGDNELPDRELLPPQPHFPWQEEFSWRYDDDIDILIFSSFEELRNAMMERGREFEEKELIQKATTLEELLEANVKTYRFEKHFRGGFQKIKIDDKIGYHFIEQFYFPTLISWRGRPDNYSIIFSAPDNKIYWFYIGYQNPLEIEDPQMKLFFQILSTLKFLKKE